MKMTVAQIEAAAEAKALAAPCSAEELISGVTWDSRTVAPGCLYVALEGERVDGHEERHLARSEQTGGQMAASRARIARVDVAVGQPVEGHGGVARDGRAAVRLVDDMNACILFGVFVTDRAAVVRAAVVHQNQLKFGEGLGEDAVHAAAKVGLDVINRDDNSYLRHSFLLPRLISQNAA